MATFPEDRAASRRVPWVAAASFPSPAFCLCVFLAVCLGRSSVWGGREPAGAGWGGQSGRPGPAACMSVRAAPRVVLGSVPGQPLLRPRCEVSGWRLGPVVTATCLQHRLRWPPQHGGAKVVSGNPVGGPAAGAQLTPQQRRSLPVLGSGSKPVTDGRLRAGGWLRVSGAEPVPGDWPGPRRRCWLGCGPHSDLCAQQCPASPPQGHQPQAVCPWAPHGCPGLAQQAPLCGGFKRQAATASRSGAQSLRQAAPSGPWLRLRRAVSASASAPPPRGDPGVPDPRPPDAGLTCTAHVCSRPLRG